MKGKAADYYMLVRMIKEIKVPRNRFRCVLVVFFYVTKVFSESVAKSSLCFADVQLFGSRYFLNVANERTCIALCASAFKSSGLITCLEYTSD